jgi:hypothetical protein
MTAYNVANRLLMAAIRNPDDPNKLNAAKKHPLLKKALAQLTPADLAVLYKVFTAHKNPRSLLSRHSRLSAALPGDPFIKRRRLI